ncbi:hypothetical protein KIPB_013574, partial [Kipferlia bialata]
GRYFSRILSPVIAEASGLFDVTGAMSKKAALRFVTKNRDKPTPPGVEGTVLVSMLYDQVCDMTKRLTDGVPSTPLPETQGFISAYYEDLTAIPTVESSSESQDTMPQEKANPIGIREREILSLFRTWYPDRVLGSLGSSLDLMARVTVGGRVSNSNSDCSCAPHPGAFKVQGLRGRIAPVKQRPRSVSREDMFVIDGDSQDVDYVPPDYEISESESEDISERGKQKERDDHAIMRRHEISFFPLCVYVKLDIVGFTTF